MFNPLQTTRVNIKTKKIIKVKEEEKMKKTRKLLALILALTLVASMLSGIVANAANWDQGDNGSIEILPPDNGSLILSGETFTAYRVFDIFGTIINQGTPNARYGYVITEEFEDFDGVYFPPLGVGPGAITLFEYLTSNTGVVDQMDSEEMDALAEALMNYINDVEATCPTVSGVHDDSQCKFKDVKTTIVNTAADNPDYPDVLFDDLLYGYYIVLASGAVPDENNEPTSETVVALAALTTTKPNAKIKLKADAPTIEKFVLNDHDLGGFTKREEVVFEVAVPAGSGNYNEDPLNPGEFIEVAQGTGTHVKTIVQVPFDDPWNKWNDTTISEEVEFMFKSSVPSLRFLREFIEIAQQQGDPDVHYQYIIHDVMSPGLSLPDPFDEDEVEIYVNDERGIGVKVPLLDPVSGDPFYTVVVTQYAIDPVTGVPNRDAITNEIVDTIFYIDIDILAVSQYFAANPRNIDVTELFTYYKATLNEYAVIMLPGNPNEVQLEYSNNPYNVPETNETQWSRVMVYTGAYSFIKVEEVQKTDPITGAPMVDPITGDPVMEFVYLEDAKFNIHRTENASDEAIWFVEVTLADLIGQIEGIDPDFFENQDPDFSGLVPDARIYIVYNGEVDFDPVTGDPIGPYTQTLITPESGLVVVLGLGASAVIDIEYDLTDPQNPIIIGDIWDDLGDYWLHETDPPVGYYLLMDPIKIQLRILADALAYELLFANDSTAWEYEYFDEYIQQLLNEAIIIPLKIFNEAFVGEFPETGSIGETILFVGSILLMGVAVIGLLVFATKGKRRAKKNRA